MNSEKRAGFESDYILDSSFVLPTSPFPTILPGFADNRDSFNKTSAIIRFGGEHLIIPPPATTPDHGSGRNVLWLWICSHKCRPT